MIENPVQEPQRPVTPPQAPPNAQDAQFWSSFPPVVGSVDIGGTDGVVRQMPRGGRGLMFSACQGTTIENAEIASRPGFCRTALFTAGHCVGSILNPQNSKRRLDITHNGKTFSVPSEKMHVVKKSDRGSDAAVIFITTECYKLNFLRPVQMRESSEVPSRAYFQKRRSQEGANPGGGRRLVGDRMREGGPLRKLVRFFLPTPQGLSVNGGDSGGGVFDENGHLTGSIAQSSAPDGTNANVTEALFDRDGIPWAKQVLASTNQREPTRGSQAPQNFVRPGSPAGQQLAHAGQDNPASFGTPPSAAPQNSFVPQGIFLLKVKVLPNGEEVMIFEDSNGNQRALEIDRNSGDLYWKDARGVQRVPEPWRGKVAEYYRRSDLGNLDERKRSLVVQFLKRAATPFVAQGTTPPAATGNGATPSGPSAFPSTNQPLSAQDLDRLMVNMGDIAQQNHGTPSGGPSQGAHGGIPDSAFIQPPTTQQRQPAEQFSNASDFVCTQVRGGWKPQRARGGRGPVLGRDPIRDRALCERIIGYARNGVVCSNTGVNPGWKPTHFSGSTPARRDFGFWGSSTSLEACLKATLFSTNRAICYFGGNGWFAGDISGSGGSFGGGFQSVDQCLDRTNPGWRQLSQRPDHLAQQQPTQQQPFQAQPQRLPPGGQAAADPQAFQGPAIPQGHGWFGRNCLECHNGSRARTMPDWATDKASLQAALQNPQTQNAARQWVNAFNLHLNQIGDMPPKDGGRDQRFAADPEAQDFKAFVAQASGHTLNAQGQAIDNSFIADTGRAQVQSSPVGQVLSPQAIAGYRSALPRVTDPNLQAVFDDPSTIFYDEGSLPAGYQDPFGVMGVRKSAKATFVAGSPFVDKRTGKIQVFSNPAGIDPSSSAKSFHFIRLPKNADGSQQKIRMWQEIGDAGSINEGGKAWKWAFPPGTVSGEVIYTVGPDGRAHVQEVRTRTKFGEGHSAWQSNIHRPFPTKQDLLQGLDEVVSRNPALANEARNVASQVQGGSLYPVQISGGSFSVGLGKQGMTQYLPEMSTELTNALLERPFKSSLGATWATTTDGRKSFGATSKQAYSIVPQGTAHGALDVSSKSCNTCHRLSNIPVKFLYPNGRDSQGRNIQFTLDQTTDAYGNTPGNDGNLRWHPFDPRTMPFFGTDGHPADNRNLRNEFKAIIDFQGARRGPVRYERP